MASNDGGERPRGEPAADKTNSNGEARFFSPSLYIFTLAAFIAGVLCYDQ